MTNTPTAPFRNIHTVYLTGEEPWQIVVTADNSPSFGGEYRFRAYSLDADGAPDASIIHSSQGTGRTPDEAVEDYLSQIDSRRRCSCGECLETEPPFDRTHCAACTKVYEGTKSRRSF